MEPEPLKTFLEARDFLFKHRTDYLVATRDFRWPVLKDFNWALDYFDVMAEATTSRRCGSWARTAASTSSRSPRCRPAPTASPTACAPSA